MNNVQLVGRLTKAVEVRKTRDGTSYSRFTLAVPRRFKKDEADFITCIAWRKTADTLGAYTHKGDKIGAWGFIQTGSYDDRDGRKVYTTDVVLEGFEFLEQRKTQEESPETDPEEDLGGVPSREAVDIDSDDLPF